MSYAHAGCPPRLPMRTGTTSIHRQLEQEVAEFIGHDDAIVFNMGYGTNSVTVPSFMGKVRACARASIMPGRECSCPGVCRVA